MEHWVASSTRMYTALLHCRKSDRNSGCATSGVTVQDVDMCSAGCSLPLPRALNLVCHITGSRWGPAHEEAASRSLGGLKKPFGRS